MLSSHLKCQPRLWLVLRVCLSAALLFLFNIAMRVQAQEARDLKHEFTLKAGFVKNFLKYMKLPQKGSERMICISAPSEIVGIFNQLSGSQSVGDSVLRVQELNLDQHPNACQVVYVTRSAPISAERVLQIFANSDVLLIGDDSFFAEQGGVIQFLERDGKIRFKINLASAKSRNIEINSQLLRLAEVINIGERAGNL